MVTVRPARPGMRRRASTCWPALPTSSPRETHDEARIGVAKSRPGAAASGGAGVGSDQAEAANGQAGVARYRAWVAEDAGLVVGFVLAKIRPLFGDR